MRGEPASRMTAKIPEDRSDGSPPATPPAGGQPDPPPTLPAAVRDGRTGGLRLAAVAIGAALLLGAVLLMPETMFRGPDFQRLHAPLKAYLASALLHGRVPLWNPHVALGRPLLADAEVGAFYPGTMLFLLGDVRWAAALVLIAHLALAIFGVVRFARRLGAARGASHVAALFVISVGFFAVFQGGSVNYACSLSLLPLVLCAAVDMQDRPSLGRVASLALLFGLQLLCHPQPAWLSGYAAASLLLGRWQRGPSHSGLRAVGVLGLLAIAAGWGAAIAAVQLLPLAELIGQSNRAGGSLELAGAFASPPAAWVSLMLPVHSASGPELSGQLYAGSAVAVAGLAGLTRVRDRNSRALLIMAVSAGLLAAGNATPFLRGLSQVAPFLSMLRVPARAGVIVALAVAVAAALYLSPTGGRRGEPMRLLAGAIAAPLLVLFCLRLQELSALAARLPVHLVAVGLTTGLVGVVVRSSKPSQRRVAYAGLGAITAVELAFSVGALKAIKVGLPDFPAERLLHDTLTERGFVRPGEPPPRVSVPFPWVRENAGMQMGWSTFSGFGPAYLGRVWTAVHALRGLQAPVTRNAFPADNVYDGGPFPYDGMSLALGFDHRSGTVALRKDADPRAWLVRRVEVVGNADQAIARVRAAGDLRDRAVLEAPLTLPLDASAPPGTVRIVRFLPEQIDLELENPAPALLVIGEAWYPGWTATVDARPAPVLPANGWMRAVPVPADARRVELHFHCTWLVPGALLSLSAAIAALLLRRRRSTEPADSDVPGCGAPLNPVASTGGPPTR